jgi:hypothetical protein
MSGRNTYRATPPQKLFENYKKITNSKLIRNRELSDENIAEFELLLNQAQPQSDDENCMRSFVQYLYRMNPGHFTRFIQRSRLSHLALWTEAKFMVRTFELRGLVYIKWDSDENKYVCSMHRIVNDYMNSGECSSMEEVVKRITRESEDQDRNRGDFNTGRGKGKGGREFNGRDSREFNGRDSREFNGRGKGKGGKGRGKGNYRGREQIQNSEGNETLMESDFPILVSKRIFMAPPVWPKKDSTETPSPSADESTSEISNSDSQNMNASINLTDIVVAISDTKL